MCLVLHDGMNGIMRKMIRKSSDSYEWNERKVKSDNENSNNGSGWWDNENDDEMAQAQADIRRKMIPSENVCLRNSSCFRPTIT